MPASGRLIHEAGVTRASRPPPGVGPIEADLVVPAPKDGVDWTAPGEECGRMIPPAERRARRPRYEFALVCYNPADFQHPRSCHAPAHSPNLPWKTGLFSRDGVWRGGANSGEVVFLIRGVAFRGTRIF